jgi:hypothetical protein
VVITSKFGWDVDLETGERRPGLVSQPKRIKQAVEGMLKRLKFLSKHDLSGKTLILFITHGGYGLGRVSAWSPNCPAGEPH